MKYTLEEPSAHDIPVIVDMYHKLLEVAYPDREIASYLTLYKIVLSWFNEDDRLRLVLADKNVAGFSLVRFNNAGGATEMILDADITYLYEEFRKTRAAYIMYTDIVDYATRCDLILMSTSTPESSPIVEKRWGARVTFNHLETTSTRTK